MNNKLNVNRLAEVLSDILSEKYDAKITVTYRPKDLELNRTTDKESAIEE